MKRTIYYKNKPKIIGVSSVAGPKESNGSIAKCIDIQLQDDTFGQDTYEKAETKMLFTAIKNSITNAKKSEQDIGALISGDLLNQIIASTFAARNFNFGKIFFLNPLYIIEKYKEICYNISASVDFTPVKRENYFLKRFIKWKKSTLAKPKTFTSLKMATCS